MPATEIPDDIYDALDLPEGEREGEVKRELAVSLYARDVISFGKARELAGLSKWESHRLLGDRDVERHYTLQELDEEVGYTRG